MARTGQCPGTPPGDHPDSAALHYQRIVVKAGTGILTDTAGATGLNLAVLQDLVRQICQLHQTPCEVLLVTSGAIAAGRAALDSEYRQIGRDIPSRQVMAAVGQSRLMQTYQEMFEVHGVQVAQTLLTTADLSHRQSYLNVRNTLERLLELKVVPVLNENDVVAVDEIGEVFGDNDRLSALVANLVDADLLLILTDIAGLYTGDPRTDTSATLIEYVDQVDANIEATAGQELQPWARGGMPTTLEAARLVTTSGIPMVMCHGLAEDAVLKAARGESVGTYFRPAGEKLEARKRWMLADVSRNGQVTVDEGAVKALLQDHRSLLPAGIQGVRGEFQRGETIYVVDSASKRIACGIATYDAKDIAKIKGLRSGRIEETLGYHYGQEIVHRNNLVLL